jgi:SAM-dependent methyltransferase
MSRVTIARARRPRQVGGTVLGRRVGTYNAGPRMNDRLADQTISDFGQQWNAYRDSAGYYGSIEIFRDMFGPLLSPEEVAGRRVMEIGSGTGRIASILLSAGAAHVVAVEPSTAFDVLRDNLQAHADRVTLLRLTGDAVPPTGDLDYVFSIGVLHHIPEPEPVLRAAYAALRPGGRLGVWLYGREGNGAYLSILTPLRAVTRRLPHRLLAALVRMIDGPLVAYVALCRALPLPLAGYMCEVVRRLDPSKRRLTIYDQLNPAYAKYYTRDEAHALLARAGFEGVALHHRHGYSWSVVGTKPRRAPADHA